MTFINETRRESVETLPEVTQTTTDYSLLGFTAENNYNLNNHASGNDILPKSKSKPF